MNIKINLNSKVKCKLTEAGWNHLSNILKDTVLDISIFRNTYIDEDGYAIFKLYEFMNIFGDKMYIDNPTNFIEDNTIIYECLDIDTIVNTNPGLSKEVFVKYIKDAADIYLETQKKEKIKADGFAKYKRLHNMWFNIK